jgi:hypothetical protein
MFGKQTRRQRAERVAGQAWDHLTSAVDTAESSVRSAKKRAESLYEDTSSRIGSGSKEAKARAQDAYDALLGRRRRGTSWGWVVAATAAGMAVGWVVTTFGKRAIDSASDDLASLTSTGQDEFTRSGV